MSTKFSNKNASLFAFLGLAAAVAVASPIKEANAGDDGKDKVECGKLEHANVKAFCEKVGGKKASIKKVMKDAEKAYKKAGKGDIECKSCHTESTGGPLDEKKTADLWPTYKGFFDTAAGEYKPKD